MQVLLLTEAESCPLPALETLAHELVLAPIVAPLHTVFSSGNERLGFRPSVILLDGLTDPGACRHAALALSGRTDVPRIALLRAASLAAITPEWQLADFLTPEMSLAEIEVRLRLTVAESEAAALTVSGIEIDESNFVARVQGRSLDLTYKEFELLHFLAAHPARVFTREQLLTDVWGSDYFGGPRTVDVHIRRLRAKLGDHEWLISTVRGVGYGFARSRIQEEGTS